MTASSLDILDRPPADDAQPGDCPRLSIVVPCYNEAESLPKLVEELRRLRQALAGQFETEMVLVDDGSADATWQLLQGHFGDDVAARMIRHETNRGIAAAIATGLTHASAEIVGSIDADCTYEPVQLQSLLAHLTDDVDIVVASPYHPAGSVVGVASWRLALSRMASRLYSLVLRNQLHTYTSCFRVYRRSAVVDLPLTRGGFVGVVELLWQLDRRGGRIVECPAVLQVRTTGQSKMRVVRTACAHLGLLAEAAWQRLLGRQRAAVVHPNSDSIPKPSGSSPLATRTT
jgi:dolichol-phosphate mannosyltransferase